MRPWFYQHGPLIVATENREELNMIAVGMTTEEYVEKVWSLRYPRGIPERGYQEVTASGFWPYIDTPERKALEANKAPLQLVSRS